MAKIIENVPNAATLINSMRSIGYDFESALADIIDNSITAKASHIEINFSTNKDDDIYLMIIDDGHGMDYYEMIEAMRFGTVKSNERDSYDLGRFGLGLKTASISQCKKFTVISMKDNQINGFSWDLDLLTADTSWQMYNLSFEDINKKIPNMKNIFHKKHGTIVLWEKFDTLDKDVTLLNNKHDVFINKISIAEKHISLVFHRYLEEGLEIKINNSIVLPIDPFLRKHPKTTIKPEQIINTKTMDNKSEKVKMQVIIIPYFKDLTNDDLETIGGKDGVDGQGFYIYRNKRLMIHGTWFKIKPKAELSRNARIIIDIPNTLDNLWSIDVKKQTAIIPKSLLSQLKGEVSDAVSKSRRIHDYKGELQLKDGSVWIKKINERDKSTLYEINQNSEMMRYFLEKLDEKDQSNIQKIFELIQFSLPYKDIYNSVSDRQNINVVDEEVEDRILLMAYNSYMEIKKRKQMKKTEIVDFICSYEPYISANIKERLLDKINE